MLPVAEHDHEDTQIPERHQSRRPLLGQLLLTRGLVTAEELREALCRQQESGRLLGQILVQIGAVTPRQLEQALQEQRQLEEEG